MEQHATELAHIQQSSFSSPEAQCALYIHEVYSLLWLPWSCCSFCKTKGSSLHHPAFHKYTNACNLVCVKETAWLSLWLFHYSVVRPTWWVMPSCLSNSVLVDIILHAFDTSLFLALAGPVRNFGKPYAVHMVLNINTLPASFLYIFLILCSLFV